jgi:hypothetical protein
MQGKDSASTYTTAQAAAIKVTSLFYRTIFGAGQSSFASVLLEADQFVGSEWTTGTVICK